MTRMTGIDLYMVAAGIAAFVATACTIPLAIKWLRRRGRIVRDVYKQEFRFVPTMGGAIVVVVGSLLICGFYIARLWLARYPPSPTSIMGLLTICMFAGLGLVDDLTKLGHPVKILVPLALAVPLGMVISEYRPIPGLSAYIAVIVVAVYVTVTANLANMHSGFNGLQSGISAIVLLALLAKSLMVSDLSSAYLLFMVLGAVAGLWVFNRYPAQILDGNVGSYACGAAIGFFIVSNGFYLSGAIMLIPHILDFSFYSYVRLSGKEFVKFGKVRPDGTIQAPSPLKMKFLFPYYFRLTEKQTVLVLYALTSVFCAIGVLV